MNEKELTHIDLFSGIGGFSLAGEWAGFKTIAFCEKDAFCQKVLQKRFGAVIADPEYSRKLQSKRGKQTQWGRIGNIPLIPEIRDFDGTKWRGATLLTGGFPCQPFSVAGQRKGKEDDRHLWPEMFRIIKEARPRWILAENVTGIVKLALGEVLSDLESIGYDFPRDHGGTPIVPVIPACGLNAPHRRYRVWILAHSRSLGGDEGAKKTRDKRTDNPDNIYQELYAPNSIGSEVGSQQKRTLSRTEDEGREDATNRMSPICPREEAPFSAEPRQANSHAPDSEGRDSREPKTRNGRKSSGRRDSHAPDSKKKRVQGNWSEGKQEPKGHVEETLSECHDCGTWQEDWYEVATRFCRVDDGVPDRVHRLKALGNAIVPQIAYEILKNIAWIENERAAN